MRFAFLILLLTLPGWGAKKVCKSVPAATADAERAAQVDKMSEGLLHHVMRNRLGGIHMNILDAWPFPEVTVKLDQWVLATSIVEAYAISRAGIPGKNSLRELTTEEKTKVEKAFAVDTLDPEKLAAAASQPWYHGPFDPHIEAGENVTGLPSGPGAEARWISQALEHYRETHPKK